MLTRDLCKRKDCDLCNGLNELGSLYKSPQYDQKKFNGILSRLFCH